MKPLFLFFVSVFTALPGFLPARSAAADQPENEKPARVVYHLYVRDTTVDFNGKDVKALAINGSIPAPSLYFIEGDTAMIYVHNETSEETSMHWHGLIVPNEVDGVPYLTTAPIEPHSTSVYVFPLVQSGTYWYHSHTGLQEQRGLYGAFIIHKKNEKQMREYVMVLSDWTNENPKQVHRSLHNATDWYAIRKGAVQDYAAAIHQKALGTKLENEWKRMLAMDVSDVYYDAFLINGKTDDQLTNVLPGDSIRIRIIDASSSTYFWLNFGREKTTVIASDGMDVVPVPVDRLMIAVSETYDVLLAVPGPGRYEFRATSEDRTNFASLWIGEGEEHPALDFGRLDYFKGMKMMNEMMKLNGSMDDMGMQMSFQQMDMNAIMYPELTGTDRPIVTLNYAMLRSPVKTTLPEGPVREMKFELTGNMNRYVWTIDNKTVSETDKILIRRGENIRIVIYNNSMMRHPMHLHGHFFRLLNGQGEYSPLKNVVDVLPMETDTIEFHASEYGDWFFHCHILYHMMSGMGRIFSYENSPVNTEFKNPKKAIRKLYRDDREYHLMANVAFSTNGTDGEIMLANTRNRFSGEWRSAWMKNDYETETHFSRFIGPRQFFAVYTGFDLRYRSGGTENTKDNRSVICAGIQYTLPWFVLADLRVDHTGRLRFQVSREDIPVTSRLRVGMRWNTDLEYGFDARFILTKYFSVGAHYDSDMQFGAGIVLTY